MFSSGLDPKQFYEGLHNKGNNIMIQNQVVVLCNGFYIIGVGGFRSTYRICRSVVWDDTRYVTNLYQIKLQWNIDNLIDIIDAFRYLPTTP